MSLQLDPPDVCSVLVQSRPNNLPLTDGEIILVPSTIIEPIFLAEYMRCDTRVCCLKLGCESCESWCGLSFESRASNTNIEVVEVEQRVPFFHNQVDDEKYVLVWRTSPKSSFKAPSDRSLWSFEVSCLSTSGRRTFVYNDRLAPSIAEWITGQHIFIESKQWLWW